jgi:hypothetical protein
VTQILLNTLVPIFAGLLLGYIAGRRGMMDNLHVRNLIVLVMNFAIPCALFSTIMRSSRAVLREHVPAALMITLVFGALYLISYIWARRGLRMSLSDAAVLALTIASRTRPQSPFRYSVESTVPNQSSRLHCPSSSDRSRSHLLRWLSSKPISCPEGMVFRSNESCAAFLALLYVQLSGLLCWLWLVSFMVFISRPS